MVCAACHSEKYGVQRGPKGQPLWRRIAAGSYWKARRCLRLWTNAVATSWWRALSIVELKERWTIIRKPEELQRLVELP